MASGYRVNVDGTQLRHRFIPTKGFGRMDDLDLRAPTINEQ